MFLSLKLKTKLQNSVCHIFKVRGIFFGLKLSTQIEFHQCNQVTIGNIAEECFNFQPARKNFISCENVNVFRPFCFAVRKIGYWYHGMPNSPPDYPNTTITNVTFLHTHKHKHKNTHANANNRTRKTNTNAYAHTST